ncbi:hypothetical protein D3C81_1831900 [compost metagenome]
MERWEKNNRARYGDHFGYKFNILPEKSNFGPASAEGCLTEDRLIVILQSYGFKKDPAFSRSDLPGLSNFMDGSANGSDVRDAEERRRKAEKMKQDIRDNELSRLKTKSGESLGDLLIKNIDDLNSVP